MQTIVNHRLSNVRLEILKAFSHQLSEGDLMEFRKTLALFFAQRLMQQADKVWTEKKWNDAEVDKMLVTKMRKKR